MDNIYILDKKTEEFLKKIEGPILIFGAGGFIGINALKSILMYRNDVYGVSRNYENNWRVLAAKIKKENLLQCDIENLKDVQKLIKKIQPKTVFNFAAYGAYSKQKDYKKIYNVNVNSTADILEVLKTQKFKCYVHAGTQSEYGLITNGPKEDSELIPNSHYAVSKVSDFYLLKYYGKVEKLPVVHLRIYSAYGPWEEPDRLIPVLISSARSGTFPNLVSPNISRDFVYVKDVVRAFILSAAKINPKIYGEAFNVGTEKKTTIRDLTYLVKEIFKIKTDPIFGTMKNRDWDLENWYSNSQKINKLIGWRPNINLKQGLLETSHWQESVFYDLLLKQIKY